MSLFIGQDAQYGQQYPNPQQLQLFHHQQQLLLQEIAIKKAQLVQHQQQQQLALLHQQRQQQQHAQLQKEQHQQMLNQQSQFYTQALQFQVNQQAKLQHAAKLQFQHRQMQQQQVHQQQHQQRQQLVESPSLESDNSEEAKRYDDIEEWEIPPKDLILKINQQVEYYFSNEYLTRDAYFLRQIRRKREGYLSMKLITNFKKVRKLVKDPRITSYCLRHSQNLQVNEDGTKVRRKFPIPDNLSRFAVSRSLLIRNLPHRLASIECLMSIFYQFGDITSVRVLRPGKEIPHDLRDGLGKLTLTDIAAVVEFETSESAANAFHRFSINNEIMVEKAPYELNVTLMGSGMDEELDSGCGSSSSGDESSQAASPDWCQVLIQGCSGDNLDEDYEAYMRSMRDEKCEENKEDVPGVIAALMDEYGAACTVPASTKKRPTNKALSQLQLSTEDSAKCGQTVRKPVTSVWATSTWSQDTEEEETPTESAQIQNILIGSALSGFGDLSLGESGELSLLEDDLLTPPVEPVKSLMPRKIAHKPKNAWAAVARG